MQFPAAPNKGGLLPSHGRYGTVGDRVILRGTSTTSGLHEGDEDGVWVGFSVGTIEGCWLGTSVGCHDGCNDGGSDESCSPIWVGRSEIVNVRASVGIKVGTSDGELEGPRVGVPDGRAVGFAVGAADVLAT